MPISAEASMRVRKLPVTLIQTMPVDHVSKVCTDHDFLTCDHWLHELYIQPEQRDQFPLEPGESWTVWSPGFMEFMGKKAIEREEKERGSDVA